MEEKNEFEQYDDYVIKEMLFKISRRELEKCNKEQIVPSREVLDTINTLVNFHKIL